MSRIANNPVQIPTGVEVTLGAGTLSIKGSKGNLSIQVHDAVAISQEENVLKFSTNTQGKKSVALSGTFRSIVSNMVEGVSTGFSKELTLIGVGYRAKIEGRKLNLSLGFSHPVLFEIPEGIDIEMPSQTVIVIKGVDKQLVGQVAANIRAFRPPEPYKGKGVRYTDEYVKRKDAKKK
ncbi:MAG: large subunit ribosomal protein L6 [Candidatus Azotimanducaceae bacterium]|jgi:large subunit ribosomal protein L6